MSAKRSLQGGTMKTKTLIFGILFMFFAIPVYAEIKEAVAMIGDGAVGLPVSLVKLVGGVFVLVGEVLIFPFTLF